MKRRFLPHRRNSAVSHLVVVGLVVSATACTGTSTPTSTTQEDPVQSTTTSTIATNHGATSEADEHLAYVEEALDFMQATFYRTEEVDWERIREWVFGTVEDTPSREGAHEAVEFAVRALATPHTGFQRPGGNQDTPVVEREPPSGERFDGDIGYLNLPGIAERDQVVDYGTRVREIMAELDAADPVCAWVLDLRESVGGSSLGDWLALGPLVGDDLLMRFADSDGTTGSVHYEDGRVRPEGGDLAEGGVEIPERLAPDAYVPERVDIPIAVLISLRTASAGEAIAITFAGRPDTRFFGEQTAGATTTSQYHEMPDGALLRVASGLYQDRTGQEYEHGVTPDTPVETVLGRQNDDVLAAALDWLQDRESCGMSSG